MNKRKTHIFSLLLTSVALLTLNIGTASFLYIDNSFTQSDDVLKDESEPIAYIEKEDTSKTYYLDIEEAIDDANSMVNTGTSSTATIVVIPGSTVRLNKSKTLNSGVDLLLPYSLENGDINKLTSDVNAGGNFYPIRYLYGTSYDSTSQKPEGDYATYAEYNTYSSDNFSDSSSANITSYLSSSLIIEKDVSLTISNNSQLVVFSQLGKAGAGISGYSSGYYSQVIMMENSKLNINDGGVLDCRGYIKEGFEENPTLNVTDKSQITNNSIINNNGDIYSPFVIYDYAGGNATVAIYAKVNECPFSSYDLPQIHTKINNSFSGSIKGRADVYTGAFSASAAGIIEIDVSAQHNSCVIDFCGADSSNVYKLVNENSYLISKYSPDDYFQDSNIGCYYGLTKSVFSKGREADYGGITTLDFYGNIETNYLLMEISTFGRTIPISTSGIYFPVPFNYNLVVNNGSLALKNDIKFLPGSSLILNNSNATVTKNIIIYDDSFADTGSIAYPKNESAKVMLNSSNVEINNPGVLGGFIETSGNSTIKNLSNTLVASATDSSGGNLSTDYWGHVVDFAKIYGFYKNGGWGDSVKQAIGNVSENVTTNTVSQNIRANLYSSGNVQNLETNKEYYSDTDADYFNEYVIPTYDVALNISLHVGSGGIAGGDSISIRVNVYSDNSKSTLVATKDLTAENGAFWTSGNASGKISLIIEEGKEYYGEIVVVNEDGTSVNSVSATKASNGESVLVPGTYEFNIADLTTNYNISVSD